MSKQTPDYFIFNGQQFVVCEAEHPLELLDTDLLGLDTTMIHTACIRGYIAVFSLHEKALVLTDLQTRVSNETILAIDGTLPEEELPPGKYRDLHYKNICHKLPYSGGLLIARNYIARTKRFTYGPNPFNYKKTLQLQFDQGILTRCNDISPLMAGVIGGIKKMEKRGIITHDYNIINYWFDAESEEEWQAGLKEKLQDWRDE